MAPKKPNEIISVLYTAFSFISVKARGNQDAYLCFHTTKRSLLLDSSKAIYKEQDIAIDFTCDLGTITKDGTANIEFSYTVPNSIIGDLTNRVEVKSTSFDNNPSNNIAEDKNVVEIILNLNVNSDSSSENAMKVSLLKGDYSITITNRDLSKIDMNVYENGVLRKDLSSKYKLKKSRVLNFNMNIVSPNLDFVFIPYGDKGSKGTIEIMRSE